MLHWSLEFQSAFPAWLIFLFGLILVAGAFFLNHRDKNPSRLRSTFRFAAAFLLFLGVSQLALVEYKVPVPGLALILDDSPSMNLPAGSGKSRLESAQNLSEELAMLLRCANVPVRMFRLSEIVPSDPAGTPLGTAVLSTLRTDVFSTSDGRERLAGVVLLTDGIATDGIASETIGAETRKRCCALFPAVIGPSDGKEVPQIYAEWLNPASTFLAGETSELKFRVSALNLPENHPVSVRLKAPDGRTLAEKSVLFPETSGSAALVFNWSPEAEGPQTLRLETEIKSPILSTMNPGISIPLTVAEHLCRVLLITNGPDWEFRNLRNLLAREPSIQLETWSPASSPLAMAPEQDAFLRPDFPSTEELTQTDVVIFDSVSPQDLGTEYVSRMRSAWLDEPAENVRPHGLVVLAGRNFRPESWLRSELSPLLPVFLNSMTFQNFPAGVKEVFLPAGQAFCASEGIQLPENLPPIHTFWSVPALSRNAQALAEAQTSVGGFPLLILGRSDRVSTLFHATDNSWRWRKNDDSFFRAYWVQMLHALRRNETRAQNPAPKAPKEQKEAPNMEEVTAAEKLPLEIPSQPADFRRTTTDRVTMAEWAERSGGNVLDPENQDAQRMTEEILLTLRSQPAAPETVETSHRFITWPLVWLALCAVLAVLFATEGKRKTTEQTPL